MVEIVKVKRLFFYANFHTDDYSFGITKKVYSQIKAFQDNGFEVTYTGYLKNGVAVFDNNGAIITYRRFCVKSQFLQHVIRRRMLLNLSFAYLSSSKNDFDLFYGRYHFFDREYIRLLKAARRFSKKVVVEAHSTPKFAHKLSPMLYVALKDKIWSRYAHYYIDFIASMTNSDLWGIPSVEIENGLDLNSIRKHNYIGAPGTINFISVAYEREVHGYDRLIKGISDYYKNGGKREIIFHIVGTALKSTKKLVKKLKLENRCVFYGPLSGKALDEVYDKANIGVGCLANHRIGSFYGSALKTKEFIAKGLPFIYGWKENGLESFPYAFCYSLDESNIDIKSAIAFYDSLEKSYLSERIRSFFGTEQSWDYQIKRIINACGF